MATEPEKSNLFNLRHRLESREMVWNVYPPSIKLLRRARAIVMDAALTWQGKRTPFRVFVGT